MAALSRPSPPALFLRRGAAWGERGVWARAIEVGPGTAAEWWSNKVPYYALILGDNTHRSLAMRKRASSCAASTDRSLCGCLCPSCDERCVGISSCGFGSGASWK